MTSEMFASLIAFLSVGFAIYVHFKTKSNKNNPIITHTENGFSIKMSINKRDIKNNNKSAIKKPIVTVTNEETISQSLIKE